MQAVPVWSHVSGLWDLTCMGHEYLPAASSKASNLAWVSGSTVLRSAPSAVLDKSNLEAVSNIGFSRSS